MSGMQMRTPKPNLNTASKKELEAVAQIGPKLSEAIIAKRPFLDWASVQSIPGIGTKRLDNLQSRFCVALSQPARVGAMQTPPRSNSECESSSTVSNDSYAFCGHTDSDMPNLNTVSEKDLLKVPNIGPKIASALCGSRPFITWSDVARVPLIGPQRLEALQSMLSLESVFGTDGIVTQQHTASGKSGNKHHVAINSKNQRRGLCTMGGAEEGVRQCFLPDSVFRGLDGQPIRVYDLRKGNRVCGGDGSPTEVTHCRTLPKMPCVIMVLQAEEIELRVPATNRIVVRRGAKKASAPASSLKTGDDVFCTGEEVTKLTAVQQVPCEVELHQVEFDSHQDVEVFTWQQIPDKTILTRPRSQGGTRRGGTSQRGKQPAARTPSPGERLRQCQP